MRGDAGIMFALRASICAGDRPSGEGSRAEEIDVLRMIFEVN